MLDLHGPASPALGLEQRSEVARLVHPYIARVG